MATYTDIYRVSDLILDHYVSHSRNRYPLNEIHQTFQPNESPDNIRAAWVTLITNSYLKYDPINQTDWAVITGEGEQFIKDGGYKEYFKGKDAAALRQAELERATVTMASALTETSNAVRADIKSNSKLYFVTLLVGLISTAATVRSCQNSYRETKLEKSIEEKDSLIQSQQHNILQKDHALRLDSMLIDSLLKADTSKTF
jgi:hypothetical protein